MFKAQSLLLFLLTITLSNPAFANEDPRKINFIRILTGKDEIIITKKQMKKNLKEEKVSHFSPVYKKKKEYIGYDFYKVMELAGLKKKDLGLLRFTCRDGYQPIINLEKMPLDLFFAVGETTGPFEGIPEGKKLHDPAPFFVMTRDAEGFTKWPWPHQVITIEKVVQNLSEEKLTMPIGTKKNSQADKGHTLFKQYCISCHSVNLVGGEIGPELNIPKNITEYRDENFIQEFVKSPSSFRAKSRMMAFPFLKDQQIKEIISYLKFMKNRKDFGKL